MSIHRSAASSFLTSASLVMRVKASDEDAWKRMVDLYGPLIFSWARRGGLSSEDAADLMQEVFCSVARAVEGFDPTASGRFRGWLWTITRNKICDHHRRTIAAFRGKGGESALEELAALADRLPRNWSDDDSEVTRQEVRSLYHRALSLIETDFQPQTWKAFWLCVVEDLPTSEVSERLGISANGVRQAKSRVLRRLRQELSDDPLFPG